MNVFAGSRRFVDLPFFHKGGDRLDGGVWGQAAGGGDGFVA